MVTRRPPIFGPEPWQDQWCHWDLWMCLVAVLDHHGDLGALEQVFVAEMGDLHGRRAAEEKWSHLTDLRRRLEAGLDPAHLVSGKHLADRTLVAKARRKVGAREIEYRAETEPMMETPRVRLKRRARYGWWPRFPADPQPWYERFRVAVEVKDGVSKGQTFKKVSTLESRLHRLDRPRLPGAERLALYRATHSALIELMERSDDSYGEVGGFRGEVWETYLSLAWRETGLDPEVYYRDLCGLLVWEKYGLGYQRDTLPFHRVTAGEVDLVAGILLDLEREHRAVHLPWEAEEALKQRAWLYVATGRLDRFEESAGDIGSDHWIPIVAMAEKAIERGDRETALRVFNAANRPGPHRAHLAEQCHRVTGQRLRHLQVVDPEAPTG